MVYNVLDVFPIGENTSVTVSGNGEGLKNGITISTPNGESFILLSVALTSAENPSETNKSTTILVKGKFTAKTFNA